MQMLDGRAITVREDREDWSVRGPGGSGGRGRGSHAPRTPTANGEAAAPSDKTGRQVCLLQLSCPDGKYSVSIHSEPTARLPRPLTRQDVKCASCSCHAVMSIPDSRGSHAPRTPTANGKAAAPCDRTGRQVCHLQLSCCDVKPR